jgi:acyl-[acyl carrier protein]--UDP-N-acetylglucosamine O-acyltransferase
MAEVHPSAIVDKDAQLGKNVVIGPFCFVRSGVSLGEGTVLEANVVIGKKEQQVLSGLRNRCIAADAGVGRQQSDRAVGYR